MDTRKNEYLQNLSECWQNNNKLITIVQCKEPCILPGSASLVSAVIFWRVLCLVFTCDQRSLLIFTKNNFEKFS